MSGKTIILNIIIAANKLREFFKFWKLHRKSSVVNTLRITYHYYQNAIYKSVKVKKKSVKIFKTKNSNFRNVKFFKNASGSAHVCMWLKWKGNASKVGVVTSEKNFNNHDFTSYNLTKFQLIKLSIYISLATVVEFSSVWKNSKWFYISISVFKGFSP